MISNGSASVLLTSSDGSGLYLKDDLFQKKHQHGMCFSSLLKSLAYIPFLLAKIWGRGIKRHSSLPQHRLPGV